jgi:hypothetical protein
VRSCLFERNKAEARTSVVRAQERKEFSIGKITIQRRIVCRWVKGRKMMALPNMQKKNLDHPDDVATYGRIKKEEVVLDGVTVHRVTFDTGAKWSNDLKPHIRSHAKHLSIMKKGVSGMQESRTLAGAEPGSPCC